MNETPHMPLPLDPQLLSQNLPEHPGVYLFLDDSGSVLYIGKAKNLKKRVLSYFRSRGDLSSKTARMLEAGRSLETILTATDKEAFILESSLIKKHLPRYNIILRDDKRYPWLCLDPAEPFPGIRIVRKNKKDGAYYFGPYSSANAVRNTLKWIERIFPLRKCKGIRPPHRSRPCLNFQLGSCLGPCTRPVSQEAYREIMDQARLFLEGRNRELIKSLKNKMETAAANQAFEEAARVRDQMRAVEKTLEKQHVVSTRLENLDVIGLARAERISQAAILFVREGYLSGSCHYAIKDEGGEPGEIVEAFLSQYYGRAASIPPLVLISEPLEEPESMEAWLEDQRGGKVNLVHSQKGEYGALIKMAISNAENQLQTRQTMQMEELLKKIQETLQLKKLPRRIEAIDISNLGHEMAVGAIVAYQDGLPAKENYRNYRIQEVTGIDDYGMMAGLVKRRLARGTLPDLFLVDGGKGHLMVVLKTIESQFGAEGPDLAAIAKERAEDESDKIFIVGRKNPVDFKPGDPILHFLMNIRDQTHRRAVRFYRQLKKGKLSQSILDFIPGIGVKRKKALLQHFGDIWAIAEASVEDLTQVPGIFNELAEEISKFLKRLKNYG